MPRADAGAAQRQGGQVAGHRRQLRSVVAQPGEHGGLQVHAEHAQPARDEVAGGGAAAHAEVEHRPAPAQHLAQRGAETARPVCVEVALAVMGGEPRSGDQRELWAIGHAAAAAVPVLARTAESTTSTAARSRTGSSPA